MFDVLSVVVPVAFVVVGSFAAAACVRDERRAREFDRRALRAVGVVTGIRDIWVSSNSSSSNSGGHWEHYPVVAFRALDGSDVQTVTKDDVKPRDYPPQLSVTVRYEPADPTVAHVCDRHASLGGAAFGFLFCLVFVAVGAGILVHHFLT